MSSSLFFLFAIITLGSCVNVTYTVAASDNSWNVELFGSNPDLSAAVGDILTFNVTGLTGTSHVFSIQLDGARYPTTPAFLNMDGTLVLEIGSDAMGKILSFVDESNPALQGRICVLTANCLALSECGGVCVTCTNGIVPDVSGNCGAGEDCLLDFCINANCSDSSRTCTICEPGYIINNTNITDDVGCSLCPPCVGFLSQPCTGLNETVDQICTPCVTPFCSACDMNSNCLQCMDGYDLQGDGTCLLTGGTTCLPNQWLSLDTCLPCTLCAPGHYITIPCNLTSDTFCQPCMDCPPGQVTIIPCNGTSTTDITLCQEGTGCSGIRPPNCLNSICAETPEGPAFQCIECNLGWVLDTTGNCTMNNGSTTCPPPPNCTTADCWSATDIQCTECNRAFYINNSDFRCYSCSSCNDNEYVSWPCEGYTDTVCSPCYTSACGPCQVGWNLDLYGLCVPQNCDIHGCGASNFDVQCAEYNFTHFMCTCPQEEVHIVKAGDAFPGCVGSGGPPTDAEVLAKVNTTRLAVNLRNGVLEIVGVAVVDINGNTAELSINSTVPIDHITDEIKQQIAIFLGGDYTADDISVEFVSKKRQASPTSNTTDSLSQAVVRIVLHGNSQGSAASSFGRMEYFFYVLALLVLLL